MNRLLATLDHPIVFVFFLTLAVLAMRALIMAGAKELGWSGLTAIAE